jgi:hypothetical protein
LDRITQNNDSATHYLKKKNIIANPCNQIFVCLCHMMLARSVFSLFSMKYMGSCPLNRKELFSVL